MLLFIQCLTCSQVATTLFKSVEQLLAGLEELKNIKKACKDYIGQECEVSKDGLCWIEVECLGARVNAPMIQISQCDDYYEDLDYEKHSKDPKKRYKK